MASTIIYPFVVRLASVNTAGAFQSNPTIEEGDVTIRVDAGARANINTLPIVDGYDVMVSVDDAELPVGWNTVSIDFVDVAGDEWKPLHISLFSDLFSVADPLTRSVPGDYASGTAGAALGKLNANRVVVTQPLAENNTVVVKYGDSYHAVDGRAIDFSSTGWPSLAGSTVTFVCGDTEISVSLVSVSGTQTVRLELSKEQIEAFGKGNFGYEVDCTLVSGHEVTLVTGRLVIA